LIPYFSIESKNKTIVDYEGVSEYFKKDVFTPYYHKIIANINIKLIPKIN